MGHFIPSVLHKWPLLPVATHALEEFRKLLPGMRAMWIGLTTVLIEMDGVHIMTDHLFGTIGGVHRRQVRMPVSIDDLPELNVVLISHGHADHLCKNGLETIAGRFGERTLYLVPKGAAKIMSRSCREVVEVDWWRTIEHNGVRFTFLPAQHWFARNPAANDTNKCLWGSWMIEGTRRVYFA